MTCGPEEPRMTVSIRRSAGVYARPAPRTGTPTSQKFLSVQEAADYGKVSTQTIRRLIKAGKVPVYHLGKQIRIDEADLIALMSS
jgi:excisionase family DNA binding protein